MVRCAKEEQNGRTLSLAVVHARRKYFGKYYFGLLVMCLYCTGVCSSRSASWCNIFIVLLLYRVAYVRRVRFGACQLCRFLSLRQCSIVALLRVHFYVPYGLFPLRMCGKPKFGSYSVFKNRTVTEPSKNLTSVQTAFRHKLCTNSQIMLKVTKSYFTCIQMCT